MLTPWQILGIASTLVMLVWLADRVCYRSRIVRMRKFAHGRRLRYCATDRFNIASRLRDTLDVTGDGEVYVRDLMYRSSDVGYHYVFTAICVGDVNSAGRRVIVASADEPHGRSCQKFNAVKIAPADLPVTQQYAALLE